MGGYSESASENTSIEGVFNSTVGTLLIGIHKLVTDLIIKLTIPAFNLELKQVFHILEPLVTALSSMYKNMNYGW